MAEFEQKTGKPIDKDIILLSGVVFKYGASWEDGGTELDKPVLFEGLEFS